AFLAALLRAQPMGFYSPATLTADARRHGVEVLRVDLLASGVEAGLEPTGTPLPPARVECLGEQPPVAPFDPDAPDDTAAHRRDGGFAVRLGLAQVKGIGTALAQTLVAERERGGPYRSLHE